jgi:hypothetical protein
VDAAVAIPGTGLGAVLAVIISYVLKQLATDRSAAAADRADYRTAITAEQERTRAAEQRVEEERRRADAAQTIIDDERTRRRQAEADAAVLAADLAGCRAELKRLR